MPRCETTQRFVFPWQPREDKLSAVLAQFPLWQKSNCTMAGMPLPSDAWQVHREPEYLRKPIAKGLFNSLWLLSPNYPTCQQVCWKSRAVPHPPAPFSFCVCNPTLRIKSNLFVNCVAFSLQLRGESPEYCTAQ